MVVVEAVVPFDALVLVVEAVVPFDALVLVVEAVVPFDALVLVVEVASERAIHRWIRCGHRSK